jgi:hypothetical protein
MEPMIRRPSLLLFALALCACANDRPADASDDTLPPAADSAGTTAQAATVDSQPSAPAAASAIILAADGLEVAGSAGAPRKLAFGAGRARVLAEVGGVLGQPSEQGTMEECPSGPLHQVGYASGMQLSFQDSAFVGWFARQNSQQRTARGIGPGSTLAQLRAAYPATKVEETSLGWEFDAGELYGIVTDTTAAGPVEVIFAGTNCIFR